MVIHRALNHTFKASFVCRECSDSFDNEDKARVHIMTIHLPTMIDESIEPIAAGTEDDDDEEEEDANCVPLDENDDSVEEGVEIGTGDRTNLKKVKKFKWVLTEKELGMDLKNGVYGRRRLGKYECFVCWDKIRLHSEFLKHMNHKHFDGKLYNCPICDNPFDGILDQKNHIRRQHPESELWSQWICSHCGDCFEDKQVLRRHCQTKHEDPFRYRCEFCEYTSKIYNCLLSHNLFTHDYAPAGVRVYVCTAVPDCGKRFAAATDRRVHNERVHLQIKNLSLIHI